MKWYVSWKSWPICSSICHIILKWKINIRKDIVLNSQTLWLLSLGVVFSTDNVKSTQLYNQSVFDLILNCMIANQPRFILKKWWLRTTGISTQSIFEQLIDMVKKPAINMQNFAQRYKPRLRQINSALIKNKIEAMVETWHS